MRRALLALSVTCLICAFARVALAVPTADHVDLQLLVQRMNVNDYSIRKQLRVDVTITSADPARLDHLDRARLTVISPFAISAKVRPYRIETSGKRFKAARAAVVFKLVEDSASRPRSNVPAGYFAAEGPYEVRVDLPQASYSGRVSFGAPIALRVTQGGVLAPDFTLAASLPIELSTVPQSFGPVYYKRQDFSNAFYQLANMDDAMHSADFRAETESPQYFFQLRAGPVGEATTRLIDPAAYIAGAQSDLIRSELANSPMLIPAGGLNSGQNLLLDFSRKETIQDGVFRSRDDNFSASAVVRERIVYMYELIETDVTSARPGELSSPTAPGQVNAAAGSPGLGATT